MFRVSEVGGSTLIHLQIPSSQEPNTCTKYIPVSVCLDYQTHTIDFYNLRACWHKCNKVYKLQTPVLYNVLHQKEELINN